MIYHLVYCRHTQDRPVPWGRGDRHIYMYTCVHFPPGTPPPHGMQRMHTGPRVVHLCSRYHVETTSHRTLIPRSWRGAPLSATVGTRGQRPVYAPPRCKVLRIAQRAEAMIPNGVPLRGRRQIGYSTWIHETEGGVEGLTLQGARMSRGPSEAREQRSGSVGSSAPDRSARTSGRNVVW